MELKFMTPKEVWGGFDPSNAPLETSIISVDSSLNLVCTRLFFTAVDCEQGRIRAYLEIYQDSRWADARAAILLLPSYRQNDNDELIRNLVREGYAVALLDYCGAIGNKEEKTTFPDALSYASYPQCKNYLLGIQSDARNTPWFTWSVIARRALEVVEHNSIVDASRIAVLGIGEGAHFAWQVAATDKRIKAIISLGESGFRWANDRPRFVYGNVPADDMERTFSTGVGAETYAKGVTCPAFILASRSSEVNDPDRAGDLYSIVKSKNKRLLITHGKDTQFTGSALRVVFGWLRENLVLGTPGPSFSPSLKFENIGGKLYLKLHTSRKVSKFRIYVSYGDESFKARHWEHLDDLQKVDTNTYTVPIPVYSLNELIIAYATFVYPDGNMVSVPIEGAVPEKLEIPEAALTRETSRIIYDGSMGLSSFEACTDEAILADDIVKQAVGPFDIKGITATEGGLLLCRSASEVASLLRSSTLHFDAYSPKERELCVNVYTFPELKKYTAYADLRGGEFWEKILLQNTDFKSAEGKNLPSFSDTKMLILDKVDGVIFNNFLWI